MGVELEDVKLLLVGVPVAPDALEDHGYGGPPQHGGVDGGLLPLDQLA